MPDLLHGNERRVYGDSAYASQKALNAAGVPRACDFTNQRVRKKGEVSKVERAKNHNKSKVRARVEHVFAVLKRLWDIGADSRAVSGRDIRCPDFYKVTVVGFCN